MIHSFVVNCQCGRRATCGVECELCWADRYVQLSKPKKPYYSHLARPPRMETPWEYAERYYKKIRRQLMKEKCVHCDPEAPDPNCFECQGTGIQTVNPDDVKAAPARPLNIPENF